MNHGDSHAGIAVTNTSTNTVFATDQNINIDQISSNFVATNATTNSRNILILNIESPTANTVQVTGVNKITQNTLMSSLDNTNIGILLDNEGKFVQNIGVGFSGLLGRF